MADTEEYFPRGGKKPAFKEFKQSSNFLGTFDKQEKKKKKPKKKAEGDDGYLSDEVVNEFEVSTRNCAVGLSYQIVKEGHLLLGRVSQVLETKVHVSLPCRMQGAVMACHISEDYNKLLQAYVNDEIESVRELPQMFRLGQYVAVKVLEVEPNNLMLSMMPQHINSGKIHTEIHKGTLLQAAVSSVEDHGYVMDLGIPNTKAFLPKKNARDDIELDTGVLTWCSVTSVTPSSEHSVVTLTTDAASLSTPAWKKGRGGLTPGAAVLFTVEKPLENGIEGHILNDQTSYVQRQHTSDQGKKPRLGQKVTAHLLFIMPTTRTPFLTLRSIFEGKELKEEQKLSVGDIVENAQVIKITRRSIVFKLGAAGIGTQGVSRVARGDSHEHLTDEQIIAQSYPIGSTHKLRVLRYHLADYSYSVTDDARTLSERYFALSELRVGQVVAGVVSGTRGLGVTVQVGRITGYVPVTHLRDAGVYIDPKKPNSKPKIKHKVGQQVQARVLALDSNTNSLLLTLKPSLLAEDLEVLQNYEDAHIGKGYTGVIKHATSDYVIVTFFNNVHALVPKNYVTKEDTDIAAAYHKGQIVKCTILKVDTEAKKMSGSLTTTPFWPAKKRELPIKRKQTETSEVLNKKPKRDTDENDEEPSKPSKKKKDKKSQDDTELTETEDTANTKKKKDKRKLENKTEIEEETTKKKKQKARSSSESDAIDTDYSEEQVITPEDMHLIDFTDCTTQKHYRKRIVSLIKSIEARAKRLEVIDEKIKNIEVIGVDNRNKKYHSAMNSEKLVVQERLKCLAEALKQAQDKLKELPEDETVEWKKAKKAKKDKPVVETIEPTVNVTKKEMKKSKKEKKNKAESIEGDQIKKIKVVNENVPVLEMPSVKDFWSTSVEDLHKNEERDEESSSSDEEQKDLPKKKRKKLSASEKVAKLRAEDERIRALEIAAASNDRPNSVEQFERALLATPDSSQLWIAYMAFHLQATEIEKARAVGRKALTTISFREEQEKLNVWLAIINIENRFGTKESQQKILEEALQMNDKFQVHSKLLDIYTDTAKIQELSSLVDLMIRKYKRDPTTFTLCGGACYKAGLVEKARQVMQKAISVLEKKEHVTVLVQFALLEASSGARERAEALFEQLLGAYPQRVDVCSVYVDMLLKAGDVDQCRQVLERMTSIKLPARKMKVLYKKWIEMEEKVGDQQQIDRIRQRAMEFIENAKF